MRRQQIVMSHVMVGIALALAAPSVAEERWGTVTGKITWGAGDVPKGTTEWFIVNPRNKGLKNVFVWLIDASDPKKPKAPPLNPDLKLPREVTLTIQAPPLRRYEPRILALEQHQLLAIKNATGVNERVFISGDDDDNGRSVTPVLAGLTIRVAVKAGRIPVYIHPDGTCRIHTLAKVFDHPYFAVTDADGKYTIKGAPAGTFNIVMWHEAAGPILGGKLLGKSIEIHAGETTEVNGVAKPAAEELQEERD